jgi:hypothetical protein
METVTSATTIEPIRSAPPPPPAAATTPPIIDAEPISADNTQVKMRLIVQPLINRTNLQHNNNLQYTTFKQALSKHATATSAAINDQVDTNGSVCEAAAATTQGHDYNAATNAVDEQHNKHTTTTTIRSEKVECISCCIL